MSPEVHVNASNMHQIDTYASVQRFINMNRITSEYIPRDIRMISQNIWRWESWCWRMCYTPSVLSLDVCVCVVRGVSSQRSLISDQYSDWHVHTHITHIYWSALRENDWHFTACVCSSIHTFTLLTDEMSCLKTVWEENTVRKTQRETDIELWNAEEQLTVCI